MRPAVFLDRDDTILNTTARTAATPFPGDLIDPELVALLPGAAEGLALLGRAGFALVVVTNQGALAAGRATLAAVEAVNDRMRELLAAHAVQLDGVYMAPARPSGADRRFNHDPERWRKPGPGMILAAACELGLDIARSWMVGDASRDLESGRAAGISDARCIQVGRDVPDLIAAAARILSPGT